MSDPQLRFWDELAAIERLMELLDRRSDSELDRSVGDLHKTIRECWSPDETITIDVPVEQLKQLRDLAMLGLHEWRKTQRRNNQDLTNQIREMANATVLR